MNQLEDWGWNAELADAFQALCVSGRVPGRVVEEQRDGYTVICHSGFLRARAAGRLRHNATSADELPAVGDWVVLEAAVDATLATIHACLPRRTVMVRKAAGRAVEAQVVAANVDVVLLVTALDDDLEPRRIERYLAAIWESGADPVLVLSKADLCLEPEAAVNELAAVAMGVSIVPISAQSGQGIEELVGHVRPGRTALLVGSSGVGKSTIVNRLAGDDVQHVNVVRARDDRGQHTTTARRLLRLPSGALLVDTPGMRELALWGAESGLADAFEDLTALFSKCRFGDCAHGGEPGCAVQAAIDSGGLDADRLSAWRKLEREMAHHASKASKRAQSDRRKEYKRLTKS